MGKINHPLFGSLGAFWIDGNDTPFYSLHDAKAYQQKNGGDILHHNGKLLYPEPPPPVAVSYTHLRAHETREDLVCRLLLEKKKKK